MPPYDREQGGFVCNAAISRYATIRIATGMKDAAPEISTEQPSESALLRAAADRSGVRGATLAIRSDFPVAAGLGGSSAAGVATAFAIRRWRGERAPDRAQVAEDSRAIEVDQLGVAGGRQDHYAAAFGGALGLRFGNQVEVASIPLASQTATELARRCVVVYTGESRISASTITAVLDAYRDGDRAVRGSLRRMRELAESMAATLAANDIDGLGSLVDEHWASQRALHPMIPTPLIDTIIAQGRAAGAIGGKALGASGGGCVLLVAAANRVDEVRRSVATLGTFVDFTIDTDGVREC